MSEEISSRTLSRYPLSLAGNPSRDPYFFVEYRSNLHPGVVKISDPRAMRSLLLIMDMYAASGGAASHFGGPSAFAEIVSALYAIAFSSPLGQTAGHGGGRSNREPWYEYFHIINDAGHCENIHYAVKANYGFAGLQFTDLWQFRSLNSPLTGHGECHIFPQGVLLSNGPLGSALAQSHGLALADAYQKKWNRVTITLASDGALMEGEAREVLASIPGFAQKGYLAPYLLIISDNNTKLSGRIDQDSFSMQPTFGALEVLGWKVVKVDRGHDLHYCYQAIYEAIQQALNNPREPVVLWCKTVKGFGHKASVDSVTGGHGFSLKSADQVWSVISEIYQADPIPKEFEVWCDELKRKENQGKSASYSSGNTIAFWKKLPSSKVQDGISKALIRAKKGGIPVLNITSDLPGSTGVLGFRKEFPGSSFDVGVAEANMVSAAAGCSKLGLVPVVDTFAQFGVTKGALPLIMASLSQSPVIAIFSHIGFQDAADGASHQSLNYLGMTLGIPHLEVWSLSCAVEAEKRVLLAIEEFWKLRQMGQVPPSYVFFLGRENFPIHYGNEQELASLSLRDPLICYRPHSTLKVLICAMGTLIPQALEAAHILDEKQIGAMVIHPGFLTRPQFSWWKGLLEQTKGRIVFMEDHQKIGGFSQNWTCQFLEQSIGLVPKYLGVQGEFGRSAYQAADLYDYFGLSYQHVVETVQNLVAEE
ncbi:MAG: thiamine pyrophosphate-dependent enzyme [Bdellovibrionaceae bacterium]|nr:thiamine pyrophosphate-dependent enzyme [Pseudobdellovibrionaceae bacterium]MDW8190535.1 transketolase C-terminal domain-containing protein [Pseudobdellovibrionaceae bacterium]